MVRQLLASRKARLLRLLHDPAMPRRDTALPRPPHMAMYSPPCYKAHLMARGMRVLTCLTYQWWVPTGLT